MGRFKTFGVGMLFEDIFHGVVFLLLEFGTPNQQLNDEIFTLSNLIVNEI